MKKRFVSRLDVCLILVVCLSILFTACSERSSSENDSAPTAESEQSLQTAPEGKVTLVLATFVGEYGNWDVGTLQSIVSDFNEHNDRYTIEIRDYTNGGEIPDDQAISKMNTEILGGDGPNMIHFAPLITSLSPDPYISRGLLVNLSDCMANDPDIGMDDIVIAKALSYDDAIYYLDNCFFFETMLGKYDTFGDRFYWTLSEYLEMEKTLPPEVMTWYNITKESFLKQVASRYIRIAIDWKNGTCDFNNADFIGILEAASRIRDTPEDPNNMVFGYGPTMLGQGMIATSMSYCTDVAHLAYEERMAGCKLSFIGYPTVDGSCGTYATLRSPIGIIKGQNTEGCWEFLKFYVLHYDRGLPVYRPYFEQAIETAKAAEKPEERMTEDDAVRLRELVSSIENVTIYDNNARNIIIEEAMAYLNGSKTAQEAAKQIQSRVSIYVAEQAS